MIFDATSKSWPTAQCAGEHGQFHEHITYWLVVSIPLKNISQLGLLCPMCGKIKDVPNHQPA